MTSSKSFTLQQSSWKYIVILLLFLYVSSISVFFFFTMDTEANIKKMLNVSLSHIFSCQVIRALTAITYLMTTIDFITNILLSIVRNYIVTFLLRLKFEVCIKYCNVKNFACNHVVTNSILLDVVLSQYLLLQLRVDQTFDDNIW